MLEATIECSTCSAAGSRADVNLLETAAETCECPDVRFYRGPAEVLEQVVVLVDPVQRRLTWEYLMEVREVVVNKMGKWLR